MRNERRQHNRYSFSTTAVVFRGKKTSEATIENLGRRGAFFKTQMPLLQGMSVRLVIDWPVKRDGHIELVLELRGVVLRTDNSGTAMVFSRYHFGARASE
jgi:hypothetical protein